MAWVPVASAPMAWVAPLAWAPFVSGPVAGAPMVWAYGSGSYGLASCGLGSCGLGSYGLGSYGLGSYGLRHDGLGSFGLGSRVQKNCKVLVKSEHAGPNRNMAELLKLWVETTWHIIPPVSRTFWGGGSGTDGKHLA